MINVYKDWTGKDFDSYEIEEGRALKDCVNGVNWENAIVFCNGNKINENYILKKGDVVAVREMPGVFSTITSALISIAVMATAFAVAEGISYLATGKGLFENLKDWLTPSIDTPKTPSQQESIPSLKGAKNQNIFGKPVPYIIGQTRLSPYKVGNGYHTVSGTDGDKQRFHCLYAVGYNDLSVGLFKFGESDFAYNGMSETYVNGEYVLSNADRAIKNGRISDFNTKKPAGKANPYLEIASTGELALYPQKVVEEGVGKQIINANGEKLKFTRAAACHAERIEIEVAFNALVAFNDKGEETNASARIGLGISFDGGNTFEPFGRIGSESYTTQNVDSSDAAEGITGSLGVTTITRAKNKNMRFVASRSITVNEAQTAENQANGYVWLRIEKEDADSTSTKVTNKAYLSYIRTWCYDKEKSFEKTLNQSTQQYEWTAIGNSLVPQAPIIEKVRDKITRVALELDATDNVAGELDELNCMVVANCKTWDSENEQWSVSKSPTANPAANIVNLMQSGMLGGFAYSDSRIDLVELGALYEECEEKGFTVGTALTNRKKLYEVIDLILSQCRAYRIASGNKYSVFIDKPIETPVCVLNNSNILKDGASNTKEFRELPDGFKVKFVNKNLGYDEDEVYIMFSEKSYDDPTAIVESVDMPFVTDPKQVAKNAWFEYAKRKLRPELWNRSVTNEANLIEIGSLVELQDDTIRVGLGDGGWIEALIVQNGLIVGMRISSRINISDLTKEYGAKITHSSDLGAPDIRVRKLAVTQAAYADTFVFDTAIATTDENAPAVGDLVSIGEFGRETISAICLNKKDKGDGKFDLTLVPYDENIYTYDQDAKVEFDPKVSGVQADVVEVDTTEYAKREELIQYMSELAGGAYEEIGNPDTPEIIKCSAERDGIQIECAALPYSGLNNALGKVHWQVAKAQSVAAADIVDWISLPDTPDLSTVYLFVRTVDGYPEWDDLNDVGSKWYFRAKVTNAYNKDSEWSVPVAVNVDNYGTWIPQRPVISNLNEDKSTRFVTLDISQPSGQNLYATVAYRVGVKRADRTEEPFYLPNVYGDPFGNENTYKEDADHQAVAFNPATSGHFIEVQRTFKQNVPLIGQNETIYKDKLVKSKQDAPDIVLQTWYTEDQMDSESEGSYDDNGTRIQFDQMTWTTSEGVNTGTMVVGDYTYALTSSGELASNPEPTVYTYKIVPYAIEPNVVHTTLGLEASVRVEPNTIQDIVNNSITSNKLAPDAVVAEKIAAGTITADKMAVDQLSAITANMGAITDGALAGNSNNFWALTAGRYNGVYRAKGTFRVGDENNYIEVKAYNRNDVEVTSENLDDGEFNTYRLFFKAGTFEVTSEISTFQNDFAIYQDGNMSRLFMTASGMTLQKLSFQEGEVIPTPLEQSYWAEHPEKIEMVAKFYADENGNLIVTNSSDSSSIGFTTEVPEGMTVYQLNSTHELGGEFVDLDYEDPDNLNLSNENQATVSPMSFLKRRDGTYETECYDGDITISSGRKFMVYNKGCFLSAGSENVKIGISKVEADWNSEKSVEWGLSAAQVSTLKLTVEVV